MSTTKEALEMVKAKRAVMLSEIHSASRQSLIAMVDGLSNAAVTMAESMATMANDIDASHLRDIQDEHMIAELRVSLREQAAMSERIVRENARLRQQLTDALAEVSELKARIEEMADSAMEMNQGGDL